MKCAMCGDELLPSEEYTPGDDEVYCEGCLFYVIGLTGLPVEDKTSE